MKRRRKSIIVLFAVLKLLVLLLIAAAFISAAKKAYSFGYRVFVEDTVSDPPGKKIAVVIDDDTTAWELADMLESKDVIRDANVFWVQYQLSEYKGNLKAGSYVVNNSWTSEEILAELAGENETEAETETVAETKTETAKVEGYT